MKNFLKFFSKTLLLILLVVLFFNYKVFSCDCVKENCEASVVKITSSNQLIPGIKATGKVGDYLISNCMVGFVIAGKRTTSGYNTYGGRVIDAAIKDANKNWVGTLYGESFIFFMQNTPADGRVFSPIDIKIKKAKGKTAVIEVTAKDDTLYLIEAYVGKKIPSQDITLTLEYSLELHDNFLKTKIKIKNLRKEERKLTVGSAYLSGDSLKIFGSNGAGYDDKMLAKKRPTLLGAIGQNISYGWYSPDANFIVSMKVGGIFFGFYKTYTMKPEEVVDFNYNYLVSKGGANELQKIYFDLTKVMDLVTINGKIIEENSKQVVAGARVHILKENIIKVGNKEVKKNEYFTTLLADKKGEFNGSVPKGNYTYLAIGDFHLPSAEQTLEITKDTNLGEIKIPDNAKLSLSVIDENNKPVPAMITIKNPGDFIKKLPDMYGEFLDIDKTFENILFTTNGTKETQMYPGKYEIVFSRGFEYEIDKKEVELKIGENKISGQIKKVIDTTGFVSGDFHLHSYPSPDSDDLLEDKISAYVGEGLEVVVATDHEILTDYSSIIKKLKVDKILTSIVGEELTTLSFGHFNLFPLKYDPNLPNNGNIVWYNKKMPEIFAEARKQPKDIVIQINHPRSTGGSYFNAVGFDPLTGQYKNQENYSENFDALEIFNGKGAEQLKQTYLDWFYYNNVGKKVTATGNSDSHHAFQIEAGYPRNYVLVGTDDPTKVKETDFINAIKSQKVIVCGGPFIEASLNGNAVGSLVSTSDKKLKFKIKVQSPSWMPLETITIYKNGKEVKTVEIKDNSKVIKFNDEIEVENSDNKKDSWYFVSVSGSKDLYPVYPGATAYSFTNGIYIDGDGNKKYNPSPKN